MTTEPLAARTVVVTAASRHGSTYEIADRIALDLARDLPAPWHVSRTDLSDLRVLDDADVVVIGSAIYYGHWMTAASRALTYLRDDPPEHLWLFSSGPVFDADLENDRVITVDESERLGEADDHVVFSGKLDTGHLSMLERVLVRAVHALSGDHRDWSAVDAWAARIVEDLTDA